MTDFEKDRFKGGCLVCGETVLNTNYIALELVFISREDGLGMHYEPSGDLIDYIAEGWRDVPMFRVVHIRCFQQFVDGVYAELTVRLK